MKMTGTNMVLLVGGGYLVYKYVLHGVMPASVQQLIGGDTTKTKGGTTDTAALQKTAYDLAVQFDVRNANTNTYLPQEILNYYNANGAFPTSRDQVFAWLIANGFWSNSGGWLK